MIITDEDFPKKICGRVFSYDDLVLIRKFITDNPSASRQKISREVCLVFGWFKPDGGLKDMSCRVALLKLYRSGLIELPAPRHRYGNGDKFSRQTPEGDPKDPIIEPAGKLTPLEIQRVISKKDSYLWNEFIERYHYLGYKPLPGAQIRYLITCPLGYLGAIGFSAAAWKVQPRDTWIGWSKDQRTEKLHLVVNNSRFLILPWVNSKNLASKILSLCAKRLPGDWQDVYGYNPVLLETFVEKDRFIGTCYKAANWMFVGCTKGRGKLDIFNEYKLPVKDIYLYPLINDFRSILVDA
ncbi:conserved hypothetical protein [Desulfofarcimen acetoxidans DSM 771]|uniref:Uncharacterized protein n=1 Tax=Desulfofarcimen acetoxidans (strain ATCC 49208 / DSM 771 / KCTC 5769 / VKM B-1644 / 5575) TaxID=485916 RepID=C8VZS6_DESAS|nr:DUF4338 domain-containing protein [Desulfofarcimen acetoxidans]ACV63054.1 conserved hypothetical protein [Desulfofarcimen acetoxidans DSM 771]